MIGKTISHYRILEKVGGGGMGVVYKAEDTKLKRAVALKFLPAEFTSDPEAKERFIHEARAASSLDHPNICNIHEIGETEDGQLFIAMACYEGETLKSRIAKGQSRPERSRGMRIEEATDLAIQIAQGLSEAHAHGIVHRDIKPANILITKSGVAKILDFGLAKLAGGARLTKTGSTVGTAAYMSPEQARGQEVDHRTDIWSLGVVLFEMLTGKLPFRGEHEAAMLYSIVHEEPQPISSVRPDLPANVAPIINKILHKEPGERLQHMRELLSQLGTMKKHETESAKALPSIAVLPFVNMSPDPENEYFSDGLSEEIINALSKLEALHVTARTSAFRFRGKELDIREIGKQLNVSTVLEGSVRRAGNKLRVTAQLINVADGYHLWSERYDRELEDVFAIQDEISLAIVDKLKVRLLGEDKARLAKRYTGSFEVYDLYLKGRYHLSTLTEEGIKRSLDYFQQAIQKDPNCALAYVGVASVYNVLALVGQFSSNETMPRAKSELLKALKLDDSLAEVHAWLGEVYLQYEWDWSSAEREFKRAIELKPNSPEAHQFYADYLIVTGSMEQASIEIERARDLDPLSNIPNTILAYQLFVLRQFDQVIEHCRKMLKTEPSFLLQLHLWRALRQQNRLSEALVECKKLFTLFISREVAEAMERVDAESGYKSAMRAAAKKLADLSTKRYISPYLIATLFAHAEDDNETLRWFEKAHAERDMAFYSIGVDPDWDRVRSNPRFTALLKKIGQSRYRVVE
ncbi:MAG: protein kinase [Ignavibacteria bacterium]|nr:protein kinase [Ignavibacteria bacterium]